MTLFSVEPLLYLAGVLLFVVALGGLLMVYARWYREPRLDAGERKAAGSSPAGPVNRAHPDGSEGGESVRSSETPRELLP